MNFWVLALYVCVASAATVDTGAYKPWKPAIKTAAPIVWPAPKVAVEPVQPIQVIAKAVVQPYVQPFEAAKAVVQPIAQPAFPAVKAVQPFPSVKAVVQPVPQPAVQPFPAVKAVVQPAIQPVPVVKAVVQPAPLTKSVVYANKEAEAPVLRSESEVKSDGYNYVYETGNGISAQATGALKRVNDYDVLAVQGAFQYITPEGVPVVFTYVADENGYQPKSDFIPVAPPVPEAIRRALDYVIAHPAKEPVQKY